MNKLYETFIFNDKELKLINFSDKDLNYFNAFHKNKDKKITFLRFIFTCKALFSNQGYTLSSTWLASVMSNLGYKITCQTIRNYLRELDNLNFINCSNNHWVKGVTSRRFIVRDTNIHMMFKYYCEDFTSEKHKNYLSNLEYIANVAPKRLEILEQLKLIMIDILNFDTQLYEKNELELFKLRKIQKLNLELKIKSIISENTFNYRNHLLEAEFSYRNKLINEKSLVLPKKVYKFYNVNLEKLAVFDEKQALKRRKMFNDFNKLATKLAKHYKQRELDFFVDFSNYFHKIGLQFFSLIYKKIKIDTSPLIRQALVIVSNPKIAIGFSDYCCKGKKIDLYYKAESFLEKSLEYFYLENQTNVKVKITSSTTLEKSSILKNKTQGKLLDKLVKNNYINERKAIKAPKLKKRLKTELKQKLKKETGKSLTELINERAKIYIENKIKADKLKQELKLKNEKLKQIIKENEPEFILKTIKVDPLKQRLKQELRSLIYKSENESVELSKIYKLKQRIKTLESKYIYKEIYVERETKKIKTLDQRTYRKLFKHYLNYKNKDEILKHQIKKTIKADNSRMIIDLKRIETTRLANQLYADGKKLLELGISYGKKLIEDSEILRENRGLIARNEFKNFNISYVRYDSNRFCHVNNIRDVLVNSNRIKMNEAEYEQFYYDKKQLIKKRVA